MSGAHGCLVVLMGMTSMLGFKFGSLPGLLALGVTILAWFVARYKPGVSLEGVRGRLCASHDAVELSSVSARPIDSKSGRIIYASAKRFYGAARFRKGGTAPGGYFIVAFASSILKMNSQKSRSF